MVVPRDAQTPLQEGQFVVSKGAQASVQAFFDEIHAQRECIRLMAAAGVLPEAFQGKTELAVLAMRTCNNLRVGWEQNLKYFYSVGGSLAVWGDLTRMLVERTGEVDGEKRWFQWFDTDDEEWRRCEEYEVDMWFTWDSAPSTLTAVVHTYRKDRREPYVGYFSVGTARGRKNRKGVSLWEQKQYRTGWPVKMMWNAEHMSKRRGFPDAYDGLQTKEEMEDLAAIQGRSSAPVADPASLAPARVKAEPSEADAQPPEDDVEDAAFEEVQESSPEGEDTQPDPPDGDESFQTEAEAAADGNLFGEPEDDLGPEPDATCPRCERAGEWSEDCPLCHGSGLTFQDVRARWLSENPEPEDETE